MGVLILFGIGLLLVAFGLFGSKIFPSGSRLLAQLGVGTLGCVLCIAAVIQSSLLMVEGDEAAHYRSRYMASSMEPGQIIALDGQLGPRAEIWGPGLHFLPLMGVLGDFETFPVVEIPPEHYGELVAIDGRPLSEDAIAARPLPGTAVSSSIPASNSLDSRPPSGAVGSVFDAERFLLSSDENGFNGQKGLQSTVLLPGTYRLNLYLYRVRITDRSGNLVGYYSSEVNGGFTNDPSDVPGISRTPTTVTEIPTGHVGVVRSNIDEGWNDNCDELIEVEQGQLSATLVPVGCKGVWNRPLTPGSYMFNPSIYDVTLIDTRAQRFEYSGGYTRCNIPLDVTPTGSIEQGERSCVDVGVPSNAADQAISVLSEGWTIPVELRVMGQVTANQAPAIVAAVGDLAEVEDRIITPLIRSQVRNIGGGRIYAPVDDVCTLDETGDEVCRTVLFETDTPHPFLRDRNGDPIIQAAGTQAFMNRPTRALDFSQNRRAIEAEIAFAIGEGATTSGINLLEVTMGEPAVPPELMIAPQRDQIASQLEATFVQEERAQEARIATEQRRATADQQSEIVAAEVYELARARRADADRNYLEELAAGQLAQARVLGEDRVLQQRLKELDLEFQRDVTSMVLETIAENPEVLSGIQLPRVLLVGGDSLENGSAIFGELTGN